MKKITLMIAAASVMWITQVAAAESQASDSLLHAVGNTFTFYHLYSKPDGKSAIEKVPGAYGYYSMNVQPNGEVVLGEVPDSELKAHPGTTSRLLLNGSTKVLTMTWIPSGFKLPKNEPNHFALKPLFTVVMQGTFIVEVSDGKEYRLKPGNVLIADDGIGEGHRMRCETPSKEIGCIQIEMVPNNPEELFKRIKMTKTAPPTN